MLQEFSLCHVLTHKEGMGIDFIPVNDISISLLEMKIITHEVKIITALELLCKRL